VLVFGCWCYRVSRVKGLLPAVLLPDSIVQPLPMIALSSPASAPIPAATAAIFFWVFALFCVKRVEWWD